MKKIIRITESELSRVVGRLLYEESDEIEKISDVERFFNKDGISLSNHISEVVDETIDNIEPKGFKNENHFLEQMGGLVTFKLLRSFYFKQKDEKYKRKVREFLLDYIPKKFKSKLKSKWNKK
jgi:hypothetical protein